MIYRNLGKTGLRVSQLGFGAMRFPMIGEGEEAKVNLELTIPMIHKAFEAGVNYIDSAVMYCNDDSQRAVGEALKGWRDKMVVSTKNHEYKDEKKWWENLENSLKYLQVESIDFYNHHGISWQAWEESVEKTVSQWMIKAKDQGLLKHIAVSSHDTNDNIIKLIDTGYFEVLTVQYNLLDRKLEKAIAYAHEKGVGVVIMGPVGGGRLGVQNDVLASMIPGMERVPELALRFVLSNPHVSMALSGMSTMEQVEENLAIANNPNALSDQEKLAIETHLNRIQQLADLYCTGCGYCMPCPEYVQIPYIFGAYNEARLFGLWEINRKRYAQIAGGQHEKYQPASSCTECGACEEKCPQKIPIRKQLKEAHEALIKKSDAAGGDQS